MAQDTEMSLKNFTLQSGDCLIDDTVRGRLYGAPDTPLIIVLGGISASRFVADGPQGQAGWWSPLVHKNGPIDLNKFQVLGLDYAPCEHRAEQSVCISTDDQAKRLRALLEHMCVGKVAAIIGASYGGMVALSFARLYPQKVDELCIISAAHRPYPLGVAWRGIQRRIVRMAMAAGNPEEGLALARELAMTTYRSAQEFSERFDGLPTQTEPLGFDVCDYLNACGKKFAGVMEAERFLTLSESIDLHRVAPEQISTPALLIASSTDQLVPPAQMQELCNQLGGPSRLVTLNSPFGHDAFLKESKALGAILSHFTREKQHAA